MTTRPTLYLTVGLPGTGKTTEARRLEAEQDALRLTKDEWVKALYGLGNPPAATDVIEGRLIEIGLRALRLGISVVLDFGLWARSERDELRSVARGLGVGVELHYLDVPADELWRRVHARNSSPPWNSRPIRRADLDGWVRAFQAPDAEELALFDPPPGSG